MFHDTVIIHSAYICLLISRRSVSSEPIFKQVVPKLPVFAIFVNISMAVLHLLPLLLGHHHHPCYVKMIFPFDFISSLESSHRVVSSTSTCSLSISSCFLCLSHHCRHPQLPQSFSLALKPSCFTN